MRYPWLDAYLLHKPSVTKDFQPVWRWIRYHIGGKMFAAICLDQSNQPYYINLKVDPVEGELLRSQYADIVPGYYSDHLNWISIKPDGEVPDDLLRHLSDNAYGLMLGSFSKKRQREILGLSCCGTDCTACPFHRKECDGCNASSGKAFHVPSGKACPIYVCAVRKHRYVSCADCQALPCAIWTAVRDPQLSQQAFEQSVQQRLQALRKVMPVEDQEE
jgi:predicted DNA-binding protein (MmcQ/YjbR family)